MRYPRLIHYECGGVLEIDYRVAPKLFKAEGKTDSTDMWFAVRCVNCQEPLGLLANIDQEGARDH